MNKKLTFSIISLIYGGGIALFYLLTFFSGPIIMAGFILFLVLVASILLWRIYESRVIIPKLIYLFLYLFGGFYFMYYFPGLNPVIIAVYAAFLAFSTYLLLLAMNVYIVTEKRGEIIPLMQPAKVVTYVSFVAVAFMVATMIYKLNWFVGSPEINLITKTLAFLFFYMALFKSSKWFFISEGVGAVALNKDDLVLLNRLGIFGVAVLTQVSIILMFFPFEAYGRAVIIGAVAYFLNSFTQVYLTHKIGLKFALESVLALVIVYILVYFT